MIPNQVNMLTHKANDLVLKKLSKKRRRGGL